MRGFTFIRGDRCKNGIHIYTLKKQMMTSSINKMQISFLVTDHHQRDSMGRGRYDSTAMIVPRIGGNNFGIRGVCVCTHP